MARMCDTPQCKGTDDVQKVVFMVVSGESCQCHGDFCKPCRDLLPGKMKALGMEVQTDKPLRETTPPKDATVNTVKAYAGSSTNKPDDKPDKK